MESDYFEWRDQINWYTYQTRLARLFKMVGSPLFQAMAEVEYAGIENIPTKGRLVMAFNHISTYDVPFIVLHLPRHPFFMAKRELFKNPISRFVIRNFGGFPVNRGQRDPWAMKQAGRILEAEGMLFMFPEGTRSRANAQLKRGKIGAVKLALKHQAPILPAAILGTQRVRWGWKANKISLQFGRPMDVAAMAGPPPHKYHTLQAITDEVMHQIAGMLPPAHRGFYREALEQKSAK
ncbi:MAG: lysophospholipid acyltransferase family protein [Anaerolineae bacterium]|nr:lysophospholipid acyltransferase family protein [Anaerolineae bacterium]